MISCTRWDLGQSLESRIGEYEAALQAWEREPGEAPAERAAALRRLADEHEFRMREWCRRLRIQPGENMTDRPPPRERERWPWEFLFVAAMLPLAFMVATWAGAFGVVAYLVGRGAWLALRRTRRDEASPREGWRTRTLRDRACASCDYDLSRHDDAIPAEEVAGWKIGPRRCSECGAMWPLAPGR